MTRFCPLRAEGKTGFQEGSACPQRSLDHRAEVLAQPLGPRPTKEAAPGVGAQETALAESQHFATWVFGFSCQTPVRKDVCYKKEGRVDDR